MRLPLLAAGLVLAWAGAAQGQALQQGTAPQGQVPQGLRVTGQVRHPASFSLEQLRAMPNATVQWSFGTEKGDRTGLYEGPLLWELVKAADPIDVSGEGGAGRSHLQHVILARGSDGYAVAIAIGEIDPQFEGKKVLVALPGPGHDGLQIAMPNDARGGRGVHDLVELEVR